MSPRTRWLGEGLAVVGELGAPALRIDRLAERLGMTKGSFYHHFDGMAGYQRDLLDHYLEQSTLRYIESVEKVEGLTPMGKLERLMSLVLHTDDSRLEVAFRAWAQQDDVVLEAQRRIDAMRIDYLRDLCVALGLGRRRALDAARAFYLLLIGAGHVVPPLPAKDIRSLWQHTIDGLPLPAGSRHRAPKATGQHTSARASDR